MERILIANYIKAMVYSIITISSSWLIKQSILKMNKFTILLLTVTIYAVCAEPLRNRPQQFRQFSRQEATTEQEETTDNGQTTSLPSNGPYSPSGWKPSGQLLVLPSRQQQPQQYLPPQQYGPPTTEYGTPEDAEVSSTAEASDSTDSNETTDEPESEIVNVEGGPSEVQANINQLPQQPGYFVQLADGSLQQVLYVAPATVGAKLQVQPAVQAQPLFVQPFYVPQAVSYTSQYQRW